MPSAPSPPSAPPLAEAPKRQADPFALPDGLHAEPEVPAPPLERVNEAFPTLPKGLPRPPGECAAFVRRKKAGKNVCPEGERSAALAPLETVLQETDVAKRDAMLVDLESCKALRAGFVRALRAEVAPATCGDALLGPILAAPPVDLPPTIHHALWGLALASRLARTAAAPPKLAPPYEKARVLSFITGPIKDWATAEAKNIEDLSKTSARLGGYGKAVAALEAGLADLRMVDAIRTVPLPEEFAKDAELRGVYEAQLEAMLDPRKDRGRDAALVGLGEFARMGVVKDERVTRARAMLGRMYAGRKIDALDELLLPTATPVVGRLPALYVGLLIDPKEPTARDWLARGELYWRSVDFDRAAARAFAEASPRSDETTFYVALALALRGGPENAAAMMRKPPPDSLGIGDTAALDALAKASGPFASIAAFDAALIKRVAAPRAPDPAYWRDVASRFSAAATLLAGKERDRALELAKEAQSIEREVTKKPP
jgi:hypothetical protein